jgi:hypothetical protein
MSPRRMLFFCPMFISRVTATSWTGLAVACPSIPVSPWHPYVGVFIAIVAVIGVVVPWFRGDAKRPEKAAWTIVMFLCVFGEMWAIYADRAQHEKEDEHARCEQLERFHQIAHGIDESIATSQSQFATTMSGVRGLVQQAEGLATLSKSEIADITGGDSFGFVVPQLGGDDGIPLVVWNHGDHPLQSVSITIAHTQDQNWGDAFYHPIYIGPIGPNEHAPVPNFVLHPSPDPKSGQDNYWIFIYAQNGFVSQSLWSRRGKPAASPWAYSYEVTKPVRLKHAIGHIPKGATQMKQLLYRNWSDEVAAPH